MIQTTLRLPDRLYVILKKKAKERGMTMNAYIVSLLWGEGKIGGNI